MDLQTLITEAAEEARKKGWDHDFPTFIALVHSEPSEALEEYRAGHGLRETYYEPEAPTKPLGIPIELADTIIRICHYCGAEGIDLVEAIRVKLAYNKTRPFKHGGKVI